MGNAAAIKAIVWKEMRENAKWAFFIGVALSIALLVSLLRAQETRSQDGGMHGNIYQPFWMTVWISFALVGMLAGLCLSLLQILPELRRDQWAFLVHRPATLGTLFVGKVAAGLLLYTTAMLVPLLVLGLWLGTPGTVAFPFEWIQFIPYIDPFLRGIVVYLGGLLAGIWKPGWAGSKLLPLIGVVAIVVDADVTSSGQLSKSLTICLGGLFVTGIAAFATFRRNGELPSNFARGRFFLAISIYFGIYALLIALPQGLWSHFDTRVDQSIPALPFKHYFVNPEGSLFVSEQTSIDGPIILKDVQGRIVPNSNMILSQYPYIAPLDTAYIYDAENVAFEPDNTVRYVGQYGSLQGSDDVLYYDSVQRLLLLYNARTRQLTGSVGEDGFIPVGDPTRAIKANKLPEAASSVTRDMGPYGRNQWWSSINIVMPHMLLALDNVTGRTLFKYSEPARQSPFITFGRLSSAPTSWPGESYFASSTRDIEIIKGGQHFATLVRDPPTRPSLVRIRFFYPPWGHIVAITNEFTAWSVAGYDYEAYVITPSGTVADSQRLPTLQSGPSENTTPVYLGVTFPPTACVAALLLNRESGITSSPIYLTLSGNERTSPLFYAVTSICAILSAIFGWLYARRAGLATFGVVGWAIGCLLLGVSGLLLLISLHSLPAREVCPSCGKRRLVTNALCEYCGTAWPARALQPTDIFAASTLQMVKQDADASYDLNFDTGR